MFKCQITGKTSKEREKPFKVVAVRREQTYNQMLQNEETGDWEDKVVGKGWEIAKELTVSAAGLKIWHDLTNGVPFNSLNELNSAIKPYV